MARGEAFTSGQRHDIDKAIRDAETQCRLEFSVFVGKAEGEGRPYTERLHALLVTPSRSVLVFVDPANRHLEIVTGEQTHRVLDDAEVELAALTMQSAFAEGDLVGGITRGVQQLAAHARAPQVRHTEQA